MLCAISYLGNPYYMELIDCKTNHIIYFIMYGVFLILTNFCLSCENIMFYLIKYFVEKKSLNDM